MGKVETLRIERGLGLTTECKELLLKKRGLSVDVFDTLLTRNRKSEDFRFYEIAQQLQSTIGKKSITACDIFLARKYCAQISYKMVKPNNTIREGNIDSIYNKIILTLGIDKQFKKDFIDIEINYEFDNLIIDSFIEEMINFCQDHHIKCIAISDMYLPSDKIKLLIERFNFKNKLDEIFSSADTCLTKSSGLLYKYVLESIDFVPGDLVHIGDNYQSDYIMAIKQGISAIYYPIEDSRINEITKNHTAFIKKLVNENNLSENFSSIL